MRTMFKGENETLSAKRHESGISIGIYLHDSVASLEYINVSNFETEYVYNMDFMFSNCYALKSIDISGFNTKSLNSMKEMFSNCISLTSIVLSNFDVAQVKIMDKMFYNCSNLTYIDISSFKTRLEEIYLFNSLPSYGAIVVKYNFYDKIKNQIPENWNKTLYD